jgi:hypothetical protein
MSKAEPTAGEWIADGPGVYVDRPDGSNIRIGCADIDSAHGVTQPSACANARLFAASKDLLAACERAELEMGLHNIAPITRELLRAAIAKAKGEA